MCFHSQINSIFSNSPRVFGKSLEGFMEKFDFFFVVGNYKDIEKLFWNILLDLRGSLLKFVSSRDDLSKSKVDIDRIKGDMEEPSAQIEHKNDTDGLIFGLIEGGSSKHEYPTDEV